MKYYFLTLIFCVSLLANAQYQNPEDEHPDNMASGVYYQQGPGTNNTLNWTYPYGTKLTVLGTDYRNFELITTHHNANGKFKLRQWSPADDAWGGPLEGHNGPEHGRGTFC